ncbi:3-hydroxyacyl-ACP dehydratase FabZ [Streptomyces sp. AV19]|uniref:3-hydroxyacyl-ACP dehydratase FabZ n=1 Tax=Streptomyces sp. AV19 TaxID=2793068 RepID=UPI0018FE0E1F|nr:3-hydroxyacyl-ACP dehydratase FabZ [Streptomyces sp. AV19]MBH1937202.1 3-hydroxyacyl-ACP dehydratase FabZ [Streptomyces sp. AV19]MDG4533475.1 3-hydroxyacyl-ACP dehydratase FabZ [Streptomyces sp. AV19]
MPDLLSFDADRIRAMLPHRWPMLLLDRAFDVDPGRSGSGIKNVTVSEPFFAGHFPAQSVMPGVLLIESMAQLVAVIYGARHPQDGSPEAAAEAADRVGYLGAIRQMKFSRLVVPGDQLLLHARLGASIGTLTEVSVRASVGSEVVAKGSLVVSERPGADAA